MFVCTSGISRMLPSSASNHETKPQVRAKLMSTQTTIIYKLLKYTKQISFAPPEDIYSQTINEDYKALRNSERK